MGYKVQSKLRIEMGDLGDNNGTPFFVEIKNPRMMSFAEKMVFAKAAKIENKEEQLNEMQNVLHGMICAWNLLDIETEQPVDVKQKDALERVPSEVVEAITKALAPQKAQEDASKNSSEQSDKSSADDRLPEA